MATEFRSTVVMELYTDSDEIEIEQVQAALREYLRRSLKSFYFPVDGDGSATISVETVGHIDIYAL